MERDEWTPGRLFGVSEGYWQSCALHAAVKLELFTRLGSAGLTADDVARELSGTDARGAGVLLNAMAAMGLLRKERRQFHNTSFSRTHLVKGSPQYLGGIILHYRDMVQTWAVLDRAIADGKPVGRPPQHTREEQESFLARLDEQDPSGGIGGVVFEPALQHLDGLFRLS